jgi:hypothetical protein
MFLGGVGREAKEQTKLPAQTAKPEHPDFAAESQVFSASMPPGGAANRNLRRPAIADGFL